MNHEHRNDDIAGGQALIEGVMMRHGNKIAAAVRRPDKEIVYQEQDYVPITKRYKLLGLMFIRGSVTLIEMMIIGMKTLLFSAEVSMTEVDEKPQGWQMALSLMISLGITILFFIVILDCTPVVRQCRLEQSGRGFGFS